VTQIYTDGMKYVACSVCVAEVPDGQSVADYTRLSVGVTSMGDLLVTCRRHDQVVSYMEHGTVDRELAQIACSDCGCGKDHNHKGDN
jgi:hypothetical protein